MPLPANSIAQLLTEAHRQAMGPALQSSSPEQMEYLFREAGFRQAAVELLGYMQMMDTPGMADKAGDDLAAVLNAVEKRVLGAFVVYLLLVLRDPARFG